VLKLDQISDSCVKGVIPFSALSIVILKLINRIRHAASYRLLTDWKRSIGGKIRKIALVGDSLLSKAA
jgi:hypothetical protein